MEQWFSQKFPYEFKYLNILITLAVEKKLCVELGTQQLLARLKSSRIMQVLCAPRYGFIASGTRFGWEIRYHWDEC